MSFQFAPVMPAHWMRELDRGQYHLVQAFNVDTIDRSTVKHLKDWGECGGHYVILDNGAYEDQVNIDQLIKVYHAIHPDEVVCPDVVKDPKETWNLLKKHYEMLAALPGNPKVMVVPHGNCLVEWMYHFSTMVPWCQAYANRTPVVGIPKYLETWLPRRILVDHLLEYYPTSSQELHLLGIHQSPREFKDVRARGGDSTLPVARAMQGKIVGFEWETKYAIEGSDWTSHLNSTARTLAGYNITAVRSQIAGRPLQ